MLFENYDQQGLLFIPSVKGVTSLSGISAYRGDLVLKQGAIREGSANDRKPPELLLHQASILADSDKMIFVSGLFRQLQDVSAFVEKYHDVLTPETVTLFFVENIANPMQSVIEGVTFKFLPYKDGMVWNETLDLLYIEKGDLKGQSAEDKVVTVYKVAKDYIIKSPMIEFEDALKKTIVVKKEAAVGPV